MATPPVRSAVARQMAERAQQLLEQGRDAILQAKRARLRELEKEIAEIEAQRQADALGDATAKGGAHTTIASFLPLLPPPIAGLVLLAGSMGAEHGERARARAAERARDQKKRDSK